MSGHGHVTPNPDGSRARCGGPAMCQVCAFELAEKIVANLPRNPERTVALRTLLEAKDAAVRALVAS